MEAKLRKMQSWTPSPGGKRVGVRALAGSWKIKITKIQQCPKKKTVADAFSIDNLSLPKFYIYPDKKVTLVLQYRVFLKYTEYKITRENRSKYYWAKDVEDPHLVFNIHFFFVAYLTAFYDSQHLKS